MRCSGLPHGWAPQLSEETGLALPSPASTRFPPAILSIVWNAMAVTAGGRAVTCAMQLPSLIRFVIAARYPSGVNTSDPWASAVNTAS